MIKPVFQPLALKPAEPTSPSLPSLKCKVCHLKAPRGYQGYYRKCHYEALWECQACKHRESCQSTPLCFVCKLVREEPLTKLKILGQFQWVHSKCASFFSELRPSEDGRSLQATSSTMGGKLFSNCSQCGLPAKSELLLQCSQVGCWCYIHWHCASQDWTVLQHQTKNSLPRNSIYCPLHKQQNSKPWPQIPKPQDFSFSLEAHQKVFHIIKEERINPRVLPSAQSPSRSEVKSPSNLHVTINLATQEEVSTRKFSSFSSSRLQTPRKCSRSFISQSPTESLHSIESLSTLHSSSGIREKKRTTKNKQKRRNQTLKIKREHQKRNPKIRRNSICQRYEWKNIENQHFSEADVQERYLLEQLKKQQKFLQSWDGFKPYELQTVLAFSQNFDSSLLQEQAEDPERTALKVMLSFAYHRDELLMPTIQSLVGQIEESISRAESFALQQSEESSLITAYQEQQTESQISRLLHEFFSQDYEDDVLYRESDNYIGNCNVCLSATDSSANQIVHCKKCGLHVHQSCYGVRFDQIQTFQCNRCTYLDSQNRVETRFQSQYTEVQKNNPGLNLRDFYFQHVSCGICDIAGGAMVHDSGRQQWYHVLCVLLNSTRYKFKEISKIKSTEILRINENTGGQSLTWPSESTFSLEAETCSICCKSAGEIVCIGKFNAHIMCCVLRGMQMKIQKREGRVEVREVLEEEEEYKEQEVKARKQFFTVGKFPVKRKY